MSGMACPLPRAVERQDTLQGKELLQVVADAHREQSAMSREAPVGEWQTLRLKPLLELPPVKNQRAMFGHFRRHEQSREEGKLQEERKDGKIMMDGWVESWKSQRLIESGNMDE
eukprot:scaffold330884_cov42-Prasinocladus_malaysianus.AAC.2